jgi:hypothetical protein
MRVVRSGTLAVLVAVGCAGREAPGPPASVRLEDLATAWSASAARPACADTPGEADLPAPFRTKQCTWPRVVRGRDFGQVTGSAAPGGALHALTWERAIADTAAAGRLADSLAAALRPRGLAEYACPNAGRRWQAAGLTVQFARGVVHGDGLLRVAVFATTLPNAMPDLLCPDAPKLAPAAPPQRESAAT